MIHISLPLVIILTNQSHRFTSYRKRPIIDPCRLSTPFRATRIRSLRMIVYNSVLSFTVKGRVPRGRSS